MGTEAQTIIQDRQGAATTPTAPAVAGSNNIPFNPGRNLFHLVNATWGVLLYHLWVPRWLAVSMVGLMTLTLTIIEVLRLTSARRNREFLGHGLVSTIIRPGEAQRISGATFFGWGVLLTLILFQPQAAEAACLVMGFGDSAAALVGTRLGKRQLLGGRTLEGSIAFVGAAFMAVFLFRVMFYPAAPLAWTAAMALAGATCGALLELLSSRLNDNLTVPVVTGALFALMLS